jgi:2-iminoacetate synthase ThiH
MSVKLAEALLERKSLMQKVEKLRERLMQNALVQEGDKPAEQPESLMSELNEAVTQLEILIKRINATNNVARLEDGATVSDAIVKRDMLNMRRSALEQVADAATVQNQRWSRNEIKFVPTMSTAELRQQVDALAKAWRELDAQIQAVNWSAELL